MSNANATLGRVVTNKFSQSNAGGDTMSNLVLSAGGVIGALGGLLLSAEVCCCCCCFDMIVGKVYSVLTPRCMCL